MTLVTQNLPAHTHTIFASRNEADACISNPRVLGGAHIYTEAANLTQFHQDDVGLAGGKEDHDNIQPYLVINFIISLTGEYPL